MSLHSHLLGFAKSFEAMSLQNHINATLPIHIKVLEKSGFNRYTLLLNQKKLSTKSMIDLELGAAYLGELYTSKEGILSFKNLAKIPNIPYFEAGLALIVRLLEEEFDFKAFVIEALENAKDAQSFELFKQMLFASFENIYHIPFVFENKPCLFQLKKTQTGFELYLYFSVFGNLKAVCKDEEITLYTPFLKVASFLSKHLSVKIEQTKAVNELFSFKQMLDLKG